MDKIKNPWRDKDKCNCIACSPTNPIGLHLEFFEDGEYVQTTWEPSANHEGWINTLHGGIQSLLIDEVSGWTVSRKLQTSGVTSKLEMQFIKPVTTVDGALTIRARIAKQVRNFAYVEAEIVSPEGTVCTKGTAVYFCMSKEKAAEEFHFTGCILEKDA